MWRMTYALCRWWFDIGRRRSLITLWKRSNNTHRRNWFPLDVVLSCGSSRFASRRAESRFDKEDDSLKTEYIESREWKRFNRVLIVIECEMRCKYSLTLIVGRLLEFTIHMLRPSTWQSGAICEVCQVPYEKCQFHGMDGNIGIPLAFHYWAWIRKRLQFSQVTQEAKLPYPIHINTRIPVYLYLHTISRID